MAGFGAAFLEIPSILEIIIIVWYEWLYTTTIIFLFLFKVAKPRYRGPSVINVAITLSKKIIL